YGLVRFDPVTAEVRSFHRSHGLQAEEFNFGAHYADRAGRLFFGGANGYNAFDPASIVFDTTPPPAVLTHSVTRFTPRSVSHSRMSVQCSNVAGSMSCSATASRGSMVPFLISG